MLSFRTLRYTLVLAGVLLTDAPQPRAQTLGIPLDPFVKLDGNATDVLALSDGRVLVVRGSSTILVFDADGADLGFLRFGIPLLQLRDGRILIADRDRIDSHASDGTLLGPFVDGRNMPLDATELPDGRVLIAEYGTTGDGRVSRFEPDGTPRGVFASDVVNPSAVLALADSRVLVGETGRARISVFSATGDPFGPFYDPGGFFGDLTQLPDGRILTAGFGSSGLPGGQVLVFDPDGTYLGPFTEGLVGASGLAIHPDGRVLVVARGDDTVYAYGVVPVASEPVPEADEVVTAVYPSPVRAGEPARLEVALGTPGEVTVTIHDAAGREVSRETHALGAGEQSVEQSVEVKTAGLAAGVYMVRVSGADLSATRRLAVLR